MKSRRMIYKAWWNMLARCYHPGSRGFKNYGERGITVCDRWRNSFQAFSDDMGPCPDGYTLERKNTDGLYHTENCKWASLSEQARNKRKKRTIEIEGCLYHVAELAEQSGVDMRTIWYRASQGWPLAHILSPK